MSTAKKTMASGYRCFLYDSAVLVAARMKLEIGHGPSEGFDVGTGDDQLAIETALCKIRSLYDFFVGQPGQGKEDDLLSWEFGFGRKSLDSDQSDFRNAIHKYAMHLTWARVRRKPALPGIPVIVSRARELELWIGEFIAQCDEQGLKPDSAHGSRYLQFVRAHITQQTECSEPRDAALGDNPGSGASGS